MNTTHTDGNQHERDLRGDPVADRTTEVGTRDKSPSSSAPGVLPHEEKALAMEEQASLLAVLRDAWEIRSACGFMWMRMAVAEDAQDAFDVGKREFEEHKAAFERLETSLPHLIEQLEASSPSAITEAQIPEKSVPTVALAEAIAREAHAGQTEPYGQKRDYIEHVEAVVALVSSDDEKVVAWLHDVIEDTEVDALELVERGIPARLVRCVLKLSRPDWNQPYHEYIGDVWCGNDTVISVKIADLREHLHPSCPDRLRTRYEPALALLTDSMTIEQYQAMHAIHGDGTVHQADFAGSGVPRTVNGEARDKTSSSVIPEASTLKDAFDAGWNARGSACYPQPMDFEQDLARKTYLASIADHPLSSPSAITEVPIAEGQPNGLSERQPLGQGNREGGSLTGARGAEAAAGIPAHAVGRTAPYSLETGKLPRLLRRAAAALRGDAEGFDGVGNTAEATMCAEEAGACERAASLLESRSSSVIPEASTLKRIELEMREHVRYIESWPKVDGSVGMTVKGQMIAKWADDLASLAEHPLTGDGWRPIETADKVAAMDNPILASDGEFVAFVTFGKTADGSRNGWFDAHNSYMVFPTHWIDLRPPSTPREEPT